MKEGTEYEEAGEKMREIEARDVKRARRRARKAQKNDDESIASLQVRELVTFFVFPLEDFQMFYLCCIRIEDEDSRI